MLQPYNIGQNYIIRTVTMILIGQVEAVGEHEIILYNASWIADTGRWHKALLEPSELQEIEPCPEGQWIVGRGAVVDAGPWQHALPRAPK